MQKQYKKITIILLYTFIFIITTATSELIDPNTYWLMVDTTEDERASTQLEALSRTLMNVGKVSKYRIQHIMGGDASYDGIRNTLVDIGNESTNIENIVFLFHGDVSKPLGSTAMLLSTYSDETVQDAELNRWLKQTSRKRILVIIDGYAVDENMGIYYGNRVTLGTGALNVIHPADSVETTGKNSFIQVLIGALSNEKTDADENRHISIIEIYQQLQERNTFGQSILAPTGDVEASLVKLSPAIRVASFPDGATISINEIETGETPKLITTDIKKGIYNVSIKKVGYTIPELKTAELNFTQGEVVNLAWVLKPISVMGTVTGPSDTSVVGTKVSIPETEYETEVGVDGTYSFGEWGTTGLLTANKEYTLYAKQGDFLYGSATFIFDGYDTIEQPINLTKKSWFEIAEFEFQRGEHQKAVNAFQNGIEETPDFPPMSSELTVMLLSAFHNAIDSGKITNIDYFVATAKLAEAYHRPELAKKYWTQVKQKAVKGSSIGKLASKRLWQMNPWRNIVTIGVVVLLIVAIVSGIWTYFRFRKLKQTEG
ncbi:PEGA domain-containing protein [Candidatus Poribacteria bacterium]|nr:PEGA domain-containing protein [Candidatus Poribacteria bacterium]